MHNVHTTPGFVVGSRQKGEAGKLISIFTRDIGLVMASAQGIRLEKSKLKPFTQDYSFGDFSFVRGKELWRLTGASQSPEGPANSLSGSEALGLFAKVALLLERLLHGEEAHPALFDCIDGAKTFLTDNENITPARLETLESLIVIRMLHHLGYIGDADELNGHLNSEALGMELLDGLENKRIAMNRHINKALKESHL